MLKRNSWMWISLLLCVFGFFREIRPSEPFSIEFFIHWRNLTNEDLTRYVYPTGTYAFLAQLVVIFLVTDMLRYKPVIIFSGATGIVIFSLLIWTDTFFGIELVQVLYGTFMAAEVAYFTYIYAKVERSKYQQVTGQTRGAILIGRFLGCAMAQFLVSYHFMDYFQLMYLSLASQVVSFFWGFLLPSVGVSLYFYSSPESESENAIEGPVANENIKGHVNLGAQFDSDSQFVVCEKGNHIQLPVPKEQKIVAVTDIENAESEEPVREFSWKRASNLLWKHFVTSYSDIEVVQWSLWWALAVCGALQVQQYIQLLWKEIDPYEKNLYYGAVEGIVTLLGALSSFAAGFLKSKKFERLGMWVLTICSVVEGMFLLWASKTNSLYSCYLMYIAFGGLHNFMITVASATIAKRLKDDSFALIFGINTLIAILFQSFLTYIVITALKLTTRAQYDVYSYYFFSLAVFYAIIGVVNFIYKRR